MPRIQTYDAPQVAENTFGGQQVRESAAQNVAGQQVQQFGEAMQKAGTGAMAVALGMAQNQAKDADTLFTPKLNDLLHNPETGYLVSQGKNAVEGYQPATDAIAKLKQETLDAIQDPIARNMAKNVIEHRAAAALNTVQTHAAQQQLHWGVQSSESRAKMSVLDAATNYTSDDAFKLSLGTALNEVDTQAKMLGWDESTAAEKRRAYTDEAYKLRYSAWQQSDAGAALAHFQQNKEAISPLLRDHLGDTLFRAAEPQLAVLATPWVRDAGSATATVAEPGTAASGNAQAAKQARGVRNNNPLNIVRSAEKWQGKVNGDDVRFETFETPEAGIRAGAKNLLTYQAKYGLNTIDGIISRWAPATENQTGPYIAAVSKQMGVGPSAKLNLKDPKTLTALTTAIITHENNGQPYSDAQISAGVGAALGGANLPPATNDKPSGAPSAASSAHPSSAPAATQVAAWRDPNAKTGIPVIDNLTPDQRLAVFQKSRSILHQDMEQARTSVHERATDAAAEYLATGKASNPPSEAEFVGAYGQQEGVRRFRALQDSATLGTNLQRVQGLSNDGLQQMLSEAQPQPGDGFAEREKHYKVLQHAVSIAMKQRQDDPVAYAFGNAAYGITPINNFADPGVMQELRKRGTAMFRVAHDYGTYAALLSKEEADSLGNYLEALPAQDKARVLGQIKQAAGLPGIGSLSGQLNDKKRTLAVAGILAGNSTTFGNDTALLYLQGVDAIKEKRVKIDDTREAGVHAEIYKQLSGVYANPRMTDDMAEAAYGIYAKLKADGSDDVQRAIRLATGGGILSINGSRVAKPYGWDDSRFRDALVRDVPKQIEARGEDVMIGSVKVAAADFAKMVPGASLKNHGYQGSYVIPVGNVVVRRMDGSPYILNVSP